MTHIRDKNVGDNIQLEFLKQLGCAQFLLQGFLEPSKILEINFEVLLSFCKFDKIAQHIRKV